MQQLPRLPRLQEVKLERCWEICRTKGCSFGLGWAQAQGNWVGMGCVRPAFPTTLQPCRPPQSTSVLARKPIGYLSTIPDWAGGWEGSRPGAGSHRPPPSSRWGSAQGRVDICLPCHGGRPPTQAPGPLPPPPAGKGSSGRRVQEQTLPSAPTDTPQSESHACPCI